MPPTTFSTAYDTWVREQLKHQRPMKISQYAGLKTLFEDDNASVSQIAHDISAPYMKPPEQESLDRLWGAIFDALDVFPQYLDKLVELVVELQKVPDGKGLNGPDPLLYWLLDFDRVWYEFVQHEFTDNDLFDKTKRQQHITHNTFLAKLTSRNNAAYDHTDRGAEQLRWTLEQTPWDKSSKTGRDAKKPPRVTVLEAHVAASAPWIELCAPILFKKACTDKSEKMVHEYPGPTEWTGPKGWSRKRWAFWADRFDEIAEIKELTAETRERAAACAGKMRDAEWEGS